MKIRNGFVSNSSSSSFTCAVCGDEHSGWDLCLSECEMYECVNGHTFHEGCVKGDLDTPELRKSYLIDVFKEKIKDYKKYINEGDDNGRWATRLSDMEASLQKVESDEMNDDELEEESDDWEFRHHAPESVCPICTMQSFNDNDIRRYIFKKYEINTDELKKEIKEKYGTYKEFKDSLK